MTPILTFRLALLSGLLLALAVFWPGAVVYAAWTFTLTPLGLFMPPFATCTTTCVGCTGDVAPCAFELTLSGITNGSCSSCTQYNGVHLCPGLNCRYDKTGFTCGNIFFQIGSAGSDFFVDIETPLFDSFHATIAGGAGITDCLTISAMNIPFAAELVGQCHLSAATCTITSA